MDKITTRISNTQRCMKATESSPDITIFLSLGATYVQEHKKDQPTPSKSEAFPLYALT